MRAFWKVDDSFCQLGWLTADLAINNAFNMVVPLASQKLHLLKLDDANESCGIANI